MSVTIRAATAQDAEPVAFLGRKFVAYLQALGDPNPSSLMAEEYLRLWEAGRSAHPRPEIHALVSRSG